MCFRMEALEYQDPTTVAYSTWDYRRNASIQEFSVVLVLIIKMRLFYHSRTVVAARCASDTCFRKEAIENQDTTTVACPKCTMVVARCASDTCFLQKRSTARIPPPLLSQHGIIHETPHHRHELSIEAFANQDPTTVASSTWDYRRNASIQELSVVMVPIMKMRLFYLSSPMVVARCASGTCFQQKRSRTRIPPPLLTQHVLRIELRLLYISRTVEIARCASDSAFVKKRSRTRIPPPLLAQNGKVDEHHGCSEMCFRHVLSTEAFYSQDSTTVAYSAWYNSRNTAPQVVPIVAE
ncbi:hypothetical protein ANTQUA_LOCUS6914 [Anthophora quadrimaculata]